MEQITNEQKRQYLKEKMSIIGPRVKALRLERKWSQAELAFYIDTSLSIIQQIEKNPYYNPTLCTLIKLARIFNTTL